MESIYLIQRCNKKEPSATGSFDDVFRLDYMGSAEFEWGAVPESLNRILKLNEVYHIERFNDIKNFENIDLILLHHFNKTDLEKYSKFLINASIGTENLKENSYLYYNIIGKCAYGKNDFKKSFYRVDLWWDILNDVFFFFGDEMKEILEDTLENTYLKRHSK